MDEHDLNDLIQQILNFKFDRIIQVILKDKSEIFISVKNLS